MAGCRASESVEIPAAVGVPHQFEAGDAGADARQIDDRPDTADLGLGAEPEAKGEQHVVEVAPVVRRALALAADAEIASAIPSPLATAASR